MRITFVGIGWEQLSISLLAAIAKRLGHETRLAFSVALFNDRYNFYMPGLASMFDDHNTVIDQIKKQHPDVLVFSPLTATYQWMLEIAQEAKKIYPKAKTIFGGVHVSAVPELVVAQPQVDFICIGEGDLAFGHMLEAIENDDTERPIPNAWFKNIRGQVITGIQEGFLQDLDSLPIFDKSLWEEYMRLGDIYFTLASRGCPSQCTFCFNSYFAQLPDKNPGKYIRHRSPEHLLQELRFAKRRYRPRIIEFEDDVFTINKPWLKRVLDLYKHEIQTPFQCLTNPRFVDEETVRWLADAGCQYIQLGVQSMDDDYKKDFLRRLENTSSVETALRIFRKYRIQVKVDHMFGLPEEPISAQEKARELYLRYPPYRIQTFWTNYFPGTKLFHQALEMKVITSELAEQIKAGKVRDFYRASHTGMTNLVQLKTYHSYEVIFKLLQILPVGIVRRISPRFLIKIPFGLCCFLTFVLDVFSGLVKRNPDHLGYMNYYCFHICRSMLNKMGFKGRKASKVYAALDIPEDRRSWMSNRAEQEIAAQLSKLER